MWNAGETATVSPATAKIFETVDDRLRAFIEAQPVFSSSIKTPGAV